jgi:hypothetical protein
LQNFNNFQKKIAFISINKYIGNGHETHHFWTFCGLFKVKGCTHTKGRQHNQPQQYSHDMGDRGSDFGYYA